MFLTILWKFKNFQLPEFSKKTISIIFIVKILFGFIGVYLYTSHYPNRLEADIFRYFDDSEIMFNALKQKPGDFFKMLFGFDSDEMKQYYYEMNNWYRQADGVLFNDNRTLIRLNAMMSIFSFRYYSVHMIFMSFISLCGSIFIYKSVSNYVQSKNLLLLVSFLVPSVLFWTSGVFKEGLVFFGIGLIFYSFLSISNKSQIPKRTLLFFFSLILLSTVKFYFLLAIIPSLLGYFWVYTTKRKFFILKYVTAFGILLIAASLLNHLTGNINIFEILVQKKTAFDEIVQNGNVGSAITSLPLEPNAISFIKLTPVAFKNALIAPLPWNATSTLALILSMENLLVVSFLIICFFFRRNLNSKQKNLMLMFAFFSISILLLIGFVTPVAGAIARYKAPLIPFILIIGLVVLDTKKLTSKIPFLSKIL